jgi:hypothetical protein
MEVIEPSRSRSSVTSSTSVSKRTGTSNSKPAVIATPAPGAALKVTMPVVVSTDQPEELLHPAERDAHGCGHRLRDGARPGLRARGVALHQLEGGRRAIAGADRLVGGRWRARGQAGLVVAPVLEPEAMEPPVPRLEEGDHRREIVRAADAVGDIVAAARIGPAGVALLVARGELDDLRAALRPAPRAAADVVGKPDLVKGHHMPLRPSDTARAMSAATWVRDCRKLSASRAMIVTLTPPPAP